MRLKKLLFALPIVLGLIFAVGLLVAQPYFDARPNDIILNLGADPKILNPILYDDASSGDVLGYVFNGLVKYDQDLNLVGDLAENWDIHQESSFFLKADSGLNAEQAVALLSKNLPEKFRTDFVLKDIKVLAPDRVELNFDWGGSAYHDGLFEVISKDKIDPVHLIPIQLDTKKQYPDGDDCDASNTSAKLKIAFEKIPGLTGRVLDYVVERSDKLVVYVRGDETEAVTAIKAVLPQGAFKVRDVETRVFRDEPLLIFHLRKGVKFHDGTEFTSRDVRFLYDKVMDESTLTVRRSDFEPIKELLTPDPYTVVVRYRMPYAPAVSNWGYGIMPAHLYENAKDFNKSPLNRAPVGTGPFKFVEWKTAQYVRLEVFNDYFEGKPQLNGIIFRVLPEPALAQMEFLDTKGLDVYGIQVHELKRFQKLPDIELFRRLSNAYTYIGWNMAVDLFKDVKVRRALTLAIDRNDIVDHIYWGLGQISNGVFPPQMWYCNPDVKPLPYDPEEARKLLAEAGWKDTDGDGILDKDGVPFHFKLIYNIENNQRKSIAEVTQQQLRKLGIQVEIASYEWSAFLERVNKRNYEACVLGWSLSLDPDPYQIWHSSEREKGFNFVNYENPEVDKLIELQRTELDQNRRKVYLFKIHQLIYNDQPYTFLIVPESCTALHKGAFRVRRTDLKTGKTFDEDITMTKAGLMYHLKDWYRVKDRTDKED